MFVDNLIPDVWVLSSRCLGVQGFWGSKSRGRREAEEPEVPAGSPERLASGYVGTTGGQVMSSLAPHSSQQLTLARLSNGIAGKSIS